MGTKPTRLASDYWVCGQLGPDDIAEAAKDGFALIINNRPDGEIVGQPSSDQLAQAATDAGLSYVHIPLNPLKGLSEDMLDQFDAAMAPKPSKTLGFCRSGRRSVIVRACAQARAGRAASDILDEANAAGHDISGMAGLLEALAGQ